ncbi:molybdenum cofactor biosynthesis protein MoaE [Acetobacter sp.]|jgi:molybdopterin synthase catalytic subunit|uniref:molybdenum cofactor biosynthesis protein MoaE n=1 Tax=Acetobacter sp. TaxID=440 RepID=UPI0025BFBB4F|nr:molybdenum cofactor biosynthesis protein MoaE [Acetobacter sp.]MCH4091473.1 molybdenum cofactor biosynthesis protein MoaE [Acetobacter sp.]MCI1299451.1 molybdenum cofactor biosynthesis protein MoaE [Acetobacter sp.]MCI1316959.1 molybdenum cofactor biosynthesis protein MoaE [Acetobacter sp.]
MPQPEHFSRIRVVVQTALFDMATETTRLLALGPDTGGLGSFLGVVRGGDGLVALELEHYPGMCEQSLTMLAEDALERFTLVGCTIIHRVGRLVVGEPIVLVLAAAAHRGAALDATRFLIDRLKTGAPFWKAEEFADGRRVWVESRQEDEAIAAGW